MKGPQPINNQIPTEDGGYQKYRAAGKLQGKKALITGGDSGIGRAIAILYAMEGAESCIVYLPAEKEDGMETKRLVEKEGGKVHLLEGDLKDRNTCKAVVERAKDAMGEINILVLNHAYQMMKHGIEELSEYVLPVFCVSGSLHFSHFFFLFYRGQSHAQTDRISTIRDQWDFTFQTNIHSFFYLAKYTLPTMKSGDTIITCASINAYIGRPDLLDYTSTKGAIVAFTRGLSNQQVGQGIRVNAVCPGPGTFSLSLSHVS